MLCSLKLRKNHTKNESNRGASTTRTRHRNRIVLPPPPKFYNTEKILPSVNFLTLNFQYFYFQLLSVSSMSRKRGNFKNIIKRSPTDPQPIPDPGSIPDPRSQIPDPRFRIDPRSANSKRSNVKCSNVQTLHSTKCKIQSYVVAYKLPYPGKYPRIESTDNSTIIVKSLRISYWSL